MRVVVFVCLLIAWQQVPVEGRVLGAVTESAVVVHAEAPYHATVCLRFYDSANASMRCANNPFRVRVAVPNTPFTVWPTAEFEAGAFDPTCVDVLVSGIATDVVREVSAVQTSADCFDCVVGWGQGVKSA